MKTKLIKSAGILLFTMILISCSKKKDDIIQGDIVSWIKPCSVKYSFTGLAHLTKKSDEGFLVSGCINISDTILKKGVVINLDSKGDTIWSKQIRINNYIYNNVFYATQNSSEGILIAGVCFNNYKNPQRFMEWLDANGNVTKKILYPVKTGYNIGDCKLIPLPDGTIYYAFLTSSQDLYSNEINLDIDLLDATGQITRSKEYKGVNTYLDRLTLLDNGNLLVAGTSLGDYPNYSDLLFLLIDGSGNEIYRRTFGSDNYDLGYSACTDHQNGYVVSGMVTYSYASAIYPISSSGIVGGSIVVADSISSSATVIKEGKSGGYNLFIQSRTRLYFLMLGSDFKVKTTLWMDNQYSQNMAPWPVREIFQLSDGSFAFLYYSDLYGQSVVKTVPLN